MRSTPLPPSTRRARQLALVLLLSTLVLGLSACGTMARLSGTTNALTVTSTDQTRTLAPSFSTAVYLPVDPQTAEVYLTDIPLDRLRDPKDTLADAQGNILHLHLFLVPKAGDTPIDATACNLTLRHLVLAGTPNAASPGSASKASPITGLYSGGGFVLPSGDPGDDSSGGSISGSSHRLVKASPAFKDPVGSGSITGRFDAVRDDDAARIIAARIESLTRALKPVPEKPVVATPAKTE